MSENELRCSSCGKTLADMGNVATEHGFSKAWEGAVCSRCHFLWCHDCRPPAPPRPHACPKCGQSLKPTAECYLWDGAFTQAQQIDDSVRKEADERKAERLDKAKYDSLLQAVREKAGDEIGELRPAASDLVAFASTLDLNAYANTAISIEKLMLLLEHTRNDEAAQAIPVIAVRYGPKCGPGGQGVGVYEPAGVRMAQALANLGRPESVVKKLLELSADVGVDWCNRLLIIACLAELREPGVRKAIQEWFRSSRPDEPLLGWVSELLARANQKLRGSGSRDGRPSQPQEQPHSEAGKQREVRTMTENQHPDCPCWKNDRCMHDRSHPTLCSLPSHVPYSSCALKPDQTRPTAKGCLAVLLPLLLPTGIALGYAIFKLLR